MIIGPKFIWWNNYSQ